MIFPFFLKNIYLWAFNEKSIIFPWAVKIDKTMTWVLATLMIIIVNDWCVCNGTGFLFLNQGVHCFDYIMCNCQFPYFPVPDFMELIYFYVWRLRDIICLSEYSYIQRLQTHLTDTWPTFGWAGTWCFFCGWARGSLRWNGNLRNLSLDSN